MGENGGINLYGYVGNSPIDFIDPLGLKKCWKKMLITAFDDAHGHPKKNLGSGDAAIGEGGYQPSDFTKKGHLKKGHVINGNHYAYPMGTCFTIYGDNGTKSVTAGDSGAGYAERRPKMGFPDGTSADNWIDVWTPTGDEDPEMDWVSMNIKDCQKCPSGWSE